MQYQVQLLHQTAKEFPEHDSRADFLRLPPNMLDIVKQDSLTYLKIALPEGPTQYDPLAVTQRGCPESRGGCSLVSPIQAIIVIHTLEIP